MKNFKKMIKVILLGLTLYLSAELLTSNLSIISSESMTYAAEKEAYTWEEISYNPKDFGFDEENADNGPTENFISIEGAKIWSSGDWSVYNTDFGIAPGTKEYEVLSSRVVVSIGEIAKRSDGKVFVKARYSYELSGIGGPEVFWIEKESIMPVDGPDDTYQALSISEKEMSNSYTATAFAEGYPIHLFYANSKIDLPHQKIGQRQGSYLYDVIGKVTAAQQSNRTGIIYYKLEFIYNKGLRVSNFRSYDVWQLLNGESEELTSVWVAKESLSEIKWKNITEANTFESDYPYNHSILAVVGAEPSKPKQPYRYKTVISPDSETSPIFFPTSEQEISPTESSALTTGQTLAALGYSQGATVWVKSEFKAELQSRIAHSDIYKNEYLLDAGDSTFSKVSFGDGKWYWTSNQFLLDDLSNSTVLLFQNGAVNPSLGKPLYQLIRNSMNTEGQIVYQIDDSLATTDAERQKFAAVVAQAAEGWNNALGETVIIKAENNNSPSLKITLQAGGGNAASAGAMGIDIDGLNQNQERLKRIIQHEFGHTLGLDHTGGVGNYPYILGNSSDVMWDTIYTINGIPNGDSQSIFSQNHIQTVKLIRKNGNFYNPILTVNRGYSIDDPQAINE
ncbi:MULTISPECIES: M66 family metalloprotease [unclassified Enterococcus]|uniref:M66 family metalloprotease n=1 Tax=unclassified Enterococcus TaxID=2608891 RepID=UPI001554B79F|nr:MULTISPECIES: M66 family metalloprotease [unclassified Enterococcus]MBS7578013.1 hypothetical protein [Enterococcus sp. MMGLQ5-2]MBS7585297.1 hypothetical protein [Enterococcus sp. MMGLQ5-1]NPD13154.1 hypothetical protein [Enterococcus sp. MMGLQ5-1]NPD37844.1 hypothetical protein [Enterococcus sp. MMGLQ5-2]